MNRLVVLASGEGTNLQAIIDACAQHTIHASVCAVISDHAASGALKRAHLGDIEAVALLPAAGESRPQFDTRLADTVAAFNPDWIVLAGWMRILGMPFLGRFPNMVVNLHPALPGEFPGLHAIERAYDEVRAGYRTQSGVMVHLVPDCGIDDGPVLATVTVPATANDTLQDLQHRMHNAEHTLLVSTLADLCRTGAHL